MQLVQALVQKYPRASVGEYLPFVALTKLVKMTGEKVFRMAQAVRKECRNSFDPLWKSGIVNGQPPSGKDWKWVCKRTLVLLHRQKKKDLTPLQANTGSLCVFDNVYNLTSILSFADLDVELESIRDLSPFWGRGQPRS